MTQLAPIVLFVYNRLEHTIETVNALKKNYLAEHSDLFIFSDAAKSKKEIKNVNQVRNYIKNINGFNKIIIYEKKNNIGLADSIIDGVSFIINKYKKVIVLEDDLITSRYFLTYLNDALNYHFENRKIMSISGYSFPIEIPKNYNYDVYIFHRCMSWGWATWKDRWDNVDWGTQNIIENLKIENFKKKFSRGGEDLYPMLINQLKGKVDSWAIRWCLHHFKNNSVCLYPVSSFVKNIGFDGSGVHCGVDSSFKSVILQNKKISVKFNNQLNTSIVSEIKKIHLSKPTIKKIFSRIKKYFHHF